MGGERLPAGQGKGLGRAFVEDSQMGAEPYFYVVPYPKQGGDGPGAEPNVAAIETALEKLRQREFAAGRYNPVMPSIPFPIGPRSPAPGAQHDSIEEAFADADADGTRSILDLDHVAEEPEFCAVAPLMPEVLVDLFGTARPTREAVDAGRGDFFEDIERGQGIYIVLYKDDVPDEILFAGYSFD